MQRLKINFCDPPGVSSRRPPPVQVSVSPPQPLTSNHKALHLAYLVSQLLSLALLTPGSRQKARCTYITATVMWPRGKVRCCRLLCVKAHCHVEIDRCYTSVSVSNTKKFIFSSNSLIKYYCFQLPTGAVGR